MRCWAFHFPGRNKEVAQLLVDLGIEKSHSRPYVSNGNPFSQAQFKTVKYHPDTPERFGRRQDARSWAQGLFAWYNHEHHHTSLAVLAPTQVHQSLTQRVLAARKRVLAAAYAKHPERLVRGEPRRMRHQARCGLIRHKHRSARITHYERICISGVDDDLRHADLKPGSLGLFAGSDKRADGGVRYLRGELALRERERPVDHNNLLHWAASL